MSGIQVHRVPALHGWLWVRRGFSLLKLAPMQLLLLVLVLKTATNLLPGFGLIGVMIAKIIMPALMVGYLSVVRQLAPDPLYTPSALPAPIKPGQSRFNLEAFIGWARNRQALQTVLLIGVLGLAIDFTALYLSGFQASVEKLVATVQATNNLPTDENQLAEMLAPVAQSLFVFLAISLPCYLFLWYAPLFAALHQLPLLKSLVFSVVAVWRNLLAFLGYAISLAILVLAAASLTQLLGMLLGGDGGGFGLQSLLLFLILPFLLAVIGCSQWACYLDTIEVNPHNGSAQPDPLDMPG